MKPSASSAARKPCSDAAASSQRARRAGCRQDTAAWSRIAGSPAPIAGRHTSTGGVSAGSPSRVMLGSVTSTPPGAAGLGVTAPVTATTLSSPQRRSARSPSWSRTTTWARPERSRRMRNVTAPSARRRCTQPSISTVPPGTADGSSAASVRDRPASAVVMIHHLQLGVALEVRAGARSRCHRTFAGVSRPRRPSRGRRPGLGRCLHRRPAVRLRSCRRLSERRDSRVTRSSVITLT